MSDVLQQFHQDHKQAVRRISDAAVVDPGIDLKRMPKGFQFQVHKSELPQEPAPRQRITFIIDEAVMQAEVLRRLTIPRIIRRVAERYDTDSDAIKGDIRTAVRVRVRHIAMYLAREITKKSYPEIGRRFGKDHSTAIHAVRKTQDQIFRDVAFACEVAELEADLLASKNDE